MDLFQEETNQEDRHYVFSMQYIGMKWWRRRWSWKHEDSKEISVLQQMGTWFRCTLGKLGETQDLALRCWQTKSNANIVCVRMSSESIFKIVTQSTKTHWEWLFVHRKQQLFSSVSVDDIKKWLGKKQNFAILWKKLMKDVDLEDCMSFFDHVHWMYSAWMQTKWNHYRTIHEDVWITYFWRSNWRFLGCRMVLRYGRTRQAVSLRLYLEVVVRLQPGLRTFDNQGAFVLKPGCALGQVSSLSLGFGRPLPPIAPGLGRENFQTPLGSGCDLGWNMTETETQALGHTIVFQLLLLLCCCCCCFAFAALLLLVLLCCCFLLLLSWLCAAAFGAALLLCGCFCCFAATFAALPLFSFVFFFFSFLLFFLFSFFHMFFLSFFSFFFFFLFF